MYQWYTGIRYYCLIWTKNPYFMSSYLCQLFVYLFKHPKFILRYWLTTFIFLIFIYFFFVQVYYASEMFGLDSTVTFGGYFLMADVFLKQNKPDVALSLYAEVDTHPPPVHIESSVSVKRLSSHCVRVYRWRVHGTLTCVSWWMISVGVALNQKNVLVSGIKTVNIHKDISTNSLISVDSNAFIVHQISNVYIFILWRAN